MNECFANNSNRWYLRNTGRICRTVNALTYSPFLKSMSEIRNFPVTNFPMDPRNLSINYLPRNPLSYFPFFPIPYLSFVHISVIMRVGRYYFHRQTIKVNKPIANHPLTYQWHLGINAGSDMSLGFIDFWLLYCSNGIPFIISSPHPLFEFHFIN